MTATTTSLTAVDGSKAQRAIAFVDQSGIGTGPYAPVHIPGDPVGNPIAVALDASVQAATTSLGTDGTGGPTLPGGSTGVRGWLRYIASLLLAPALPTGAATSSGQSAALTALEQLHTDLTASSGGGSSGEATAANQVTGNAALAQLHSDLTVAPLGASGVATVTHSFSASGDGPAFTPLAGRDFNFSIDGTFAGTIQITRLMPGDVSQIWRQITVLGNALYVWTAPCSESLREDQVGVEYRAECVVLNSGTANTRFEQ